MALLTGLLLAQSISTARAGIVPYNGGVESPTIVTAFSAASAGFLNIWFGGHGPASHTDILMVFINGIDTGHTINNQTAVVGQYFNFGPLNAGDLVTFKLHDETAGKTWVQKPWKNADGVNHLYATTFAGGLVGSTLVPSSIYVGFEDSAGGANYDYQDLQIFMKSGVVASVPEPSSWAMMILGFAALGFVAYRLKAQPPGARLT